MPSIPSVLLSGIANPSNLRISSYNPADVLNQRLNTIAGQTPNQTAGYSSIRTNVNRTVEEQIFLHTKSRVLKQYQFPVLDFPKYNFTLIENDVALAGRLTPEKVYKLPLPFPIADAYSVGYKQDFSYLNAIKDTASFAGLIFGGAATAAAITAAITATTSFINTASLGSAIVNTFKSVTLDSPEFRNFELNWRFVPRNYEEARQIQSLLTSLKRGSAARFASFSDTKDSVSVPGLFAYPKVYTMFFQPNVQFLYKFKPAVLRGLTIHYDGGSGAPAFYRPEEENVENSPPESIILNTSWLEIEYWKREDFKDDPNIPGLPSSNPLDAIDDTRYNRFVQPGRGAEPTIPGIDLENPNINNPGGEFGTGA